MHNSYIMLQEVKELLLPFPWTSSAQYKESFWVYYNSFVRLFIARWTSQKDKVNIVEYIGQHATTLVENEEMTEEEILAYIQEWYMLCYTKWTPYK